MIALPSPPSPPPVAGSDRGALIALLAGGVAIGFAPIFFRSGELGPVASAFWRLALAFPVLALWLLAERRRHPQAPRPSSLRDVFDLALAGFCFAGDLSAWHWSLEWTSVANGTLLCNFAPIFVTLYAWLLFRERFSLTFLAGLALAVAGATMLIGASLSFSPTHSVGDGLALVSAQLYAGYLMAVGRLRQRFSTATIMTWSGLAAVLALLVLTLATGERLFATTWQGWLMLAGLGLFSQAAGQSLIAYALAHLPAAFGAVGLLIQPATAAVLAWVLLGEALGPWQAAGAAVVAAGIVLARRGSG
jgi:drug/metabolite transporter (DMT)-like permease